MKFRYPRPMFAIRAMAFLAILAGILYLMGLANVSISWLMGFSLIYIITIFIAYITPMFTQHEISGDGIRICQGAIFNTRFPFHLVESVEPYSPGRSFWGPSSRRGRIILASVNKNLVIIKLNHSKRFGMVLLRKADEIIIDLDRPEEFIKLANEFLAEHSK